MKKQLCSTIGILLMCTVTLSAQPCSYSLTMQPNAANGMDAYISNYSTQANTNYGVHSDLDAIAWTVSGIPVVARGLIRFDLSSIPANATVQNATLTLYNNPTSSNGALNGSHSNLSGSDA